MFTHSLWTTWNGIIHEKDEDGLLMEEGHQLHQDIEEQFTLGNREMNAHECSLLDMEKDQVLAMRAADRKQWLQVVTLEREVAGHQGAHKQGHMQVTMESWLASGGRVQEGMEEQREVQGQREVGKRRRSFAEEVPRCQVGREDHGPQAHQVEDGGRTFQENRIWDQGHPSA